MKTHINHIECLCMLLYYHFSPLEPRSPNHDNALVHKLRSIKT